MARIQLKNKASKKKATAKKAVAKSVRKPVRKTAKRAPKKTASKRPRKASGSKAAKGKRYTDAEKREVCEFVEKVNLEKGRGGVAAAVRRFGITALTVSSWVRKAGVGALPVSVRGKSGTGVETVLAELIDLQKQISKRRAELEKLQARFLALKKAL